MSLQFTRNAKVYIVEDGSISPTGQAWQIGVLDGFSFSQSINSTEITINEAGLTSRRARLLFNDSLAPVEWSFSTYARPFKDTVESPDQVRCPEEALWAMLMGADTYSAGVFTASGVSSPANNVVNEPTPTTNTFDFSASNVSYFPDTWAIIIAFEDDTNKQYYKMSKAVVNSATIDFDIEGIATIAWSGFAQGITDLGITTPALISSARATGLTDTSNFIRNRISTVTLQRIDYPAGDIPVGSPTKDNYNIVLTGGSFTIENNISYLIPEELGLVNQPLANITGARSISGNITCYLDNDITNSKSGELFKDLVEDTTTVRNKFDMAINIGGETESTPRVTLALPTAHLEVPAIGVEDLITLDIAFHGQVSGGDVDNTDEATIVYKA